MSEGYSLLDQAWMSQAMPAPASRTQKKRAKSKRSKKPRPPEAPGGHDNIFMTSFAPYEPAVYANDDDAMHGPENDDNTGYSREESTTAVCCPPPVPCPACPECPPPHDPRYDIFLFAFSGVLMLFVMEQFLQLGIAIGSRSAVYRESFSAR